MLVDRAMQALQDSEAALRLIVQGLADLDSPDDACRGEPVGDHLPFERVTSLCEAPPCHPLPRPNPLFAS
jgi:hypothetical protein